MSYSELTIFINHILDQKGLVNIQPAVRNQLVNDLEVRLMDQINRALVDAIPSSKLTDFEKIASSGADDSKVQSFFVENNIDTQSITTDTMVQFKNKYLGIS